MAFQQSELPTPMLHGRPGPGFPHTRGGNETPTGYEKNWLPSGQWMISQNTWRTSRMNPLATRAPCPKPTKEHHDQERKTAEERDVNHPQNWSLRAKMSTYLTICGFTFSANVNSSNFTVATQEIIKEFHVSQTQAGQLVCFNVFLFGVGNIFWVPLMRVVGKRPVYLVAILALSMMNVWYSQAVSYNELLASRILSGFPAAAADATVPAVVTDMFGPQDCGHYMMFFHLALTTGLFMGPLINAYLVQERDWRWMCYFLSIAVGIRFVVSVFTIRETSYVKRLPAGSSSTTTRSPWQWMSLTIGYNREASFIRASMDIWPMPVIRH